jgi:hypothetical protein
MNTTWWMRVLLVIASYHHIEELRGGQKPCGREEGGANRDSTGSTPGKRHRSEYCGFFTINSYSRDAICSQASIPGNLKISFLDIDDNSPGH